MRKIKFLTKLNKKGKLKLVESSGEICESYLEKSKNSLKAAQVLFESTLYEESVSMSYYAMYHCLIALLFKCGIKCENHAASIILLDRLFGEGELYSIVSKAKEERIDKQYYVDFEVVKKDAEDMIKIAQDFTIKLRLIIEELNKSDIDNFRKKFNKLI